MNSPALIRSFVAVALSQALLATAVAAEAGEPESSGSMSALQEITITAQRTTEAEAREAQEDAENIVNVMTFDEIRKLPVVNTGDAVRQIPGVQGKLTPVRGAS